MLINAKVQKGKKSKENSQKNIKAVEKNCRLKPLSSTLKSVNSLVSTTSEREKESQRSPEFLGRNYSHCESTKTANYTNDILGKKFSVQLSRENSQRLYTETKNMTQISLRTKNAEIQPCQKQILKWLPIKSADKTRKNTAATTAASQPTMSTNNYILAKEDMTTSFDSKNKGAGELANVERNLAVSLCSDLRSFLKSAMKCELVKKPEMQVGRSNSMNKKRADGKKGNSMPNSPKGVATTLSRMTEAELLLLKKAKEKSSYNEQPKKRNLENKAGRGPDELTNEEFQYRVPNNSLILEESELKQLLNNPNIQASSSFRPGHVMKLLQSHRFQNRNCSSSLLHENIREEALLSLLERKFSTEQVVVNKANKFIKSKPATKQPREKMQPGDRKQVAAVDKRQADEEEEEKARGDSPAEGRKKISKAANAEGGEKDLMKSLFALKDRFKMALDKLKKKLDRRKEFYMSLKESKLNE